MSDYPRPAQETPQHRVYAPDAAVAALYAVLLIVSTVLWVVRTVHRWNGHVESGFRAWLPYFEFYAGALLLYFIVLWQFACRRLGGFVAVLLIATLTAVSSIRAGNYLQAVLICLLLAYVLARLSRRLGPRPLRRRDFREAPSGVPVG